MNPEGTLDEPEDSSLDDAFILVVVPAFIVFRYGKEMLWHPDHRSDRLFLVTAAVGLRIGEEAFFSQKKKASDGSFLNKSPTKQPWRRTTWVFSSVRRPYAEVSFRDNPNQLSIITVNYRSYFQSTSDFTKNASASARRTAQVPVHPPRAVGKKSHFFLCLLPENWLSSF